MLNELFRLNDCEIRGDFWVGAVKRELGNKRIYFKLLEMYQSGMLLEFCPNTYLKC